METTVVERNDVGVVTITRNRPGRKNALNGTMWPELSSALDAIQTQRRGSRVQGR